MSEPSPKPPRRLRSAPQTMRERAERTADQSQKPGRFTKVGQVFRPLAGVRQWKVWKPFGFVGHLVARFIIPPYIRRSFAELRLVTWPNRRQTFALTSAVILFSVVFGIVVAIFDWGLDRLFKQVLIR